MYVVSGDYVALLTFHSYTNPTGRCVECGGGSECCDVSSPVPSHESCPVEDTCDVGLRYCVRDVGSTGINCPNNNQRLPTAGIFLNSRLIIFNDSVFGFPNPVPIVGEEPWKVSYNECLNHPR